jgi:hypothetical protein
MFFQIVCFYIFTAVKTSKLLVLMSMGWDYVSELRHPTGQLFIHQMIYEYGEPRWINIDRLKPNNSEKNL